MHIISEAVSGGESLIEFTMWVRELVLHDSPMFVGECKLHVHSTAPQKWTLLRPSLRAYIQKYPHFRGFRYTSGGRGNVHVYSCW